MKKAFSLIELLISLIVISLIIAAFTPMLSKKLKHREVTYSKIKQMKIDCSPFNTSQGQCLLCDERQCNLCTSSINVPDGYYVNPNLSCNRKPCSDFNSNCKRCTKDGCQECKSGYILNADGSCVYDPCGSSAVLIGKDNLKFCMKKRNLGDGADYGTVESSWYTNTTSDTTPKCWRGSGLYYTCTESLGGGYSGCNRTACNWTAGIQGCQKIGWDLPTREQLDVVVKYYSTYSSDLQFCGSGSNTTPRCVDGGTCTGAGSNKYWLRDYWGYRKGDTSKFSYIRFSGDSPVIGSDSGTNKHTSFSVRCTKTLK